MTLSNIYKDFNIDELFLLHIFVILLQPFILSAASYGCLSAPQRLILIHFTAGSNRCMD